jgi:hypothetical protein
MLSKKKTLALRPFHGRYMSSCTWIRALGICSLVYRVWTSLRRTLVAFYFGCRVYLIQFKTRLQNDDESSDYTVIV